MSTRPDVIKMAPVVSALTERGAFRQVVVHGEQHDAASVSAGAIAALGLLEPDHRLGVGSGAHGEQTARALLAFEAVLVAERPIAVVVAGSGNATLGCALAAVKVGIPVAHVEAGLRSFAWSDPDEVNRVLTDRLADLAFTHSAQAAENLHAEGVVDGRIHHVGNTLVDSLRRHERRARERRAWEPFGVGRGEYVLVTLHRPANVDDPARLGRIVDALGELATRSPVLFPVDPYTRRRIGTDAIRRLERAGVRCTDAPGYLDFLSLQGGAGAVVTDSGAVQEETSALGVCCYTLGSLTARPVTLTHGTNTLLGDDPAAIAAVTRAASEPTPAAIPLWDGRAGARVADALIANYALRDGAATPSPVDGSSIYR